MNSSSDVRTSSFPGAGTFPVAFVVLAVVALFVVPFLMGRRAARAQREVAETLEPASVLATRLSLKQALEMSLFQAYLMTEESEYQRRYDEAQRQEDTLYAQLQRTVAGLDLQGVPEQLAALSTDAEAWHLLQQPAFGSAQARRAAIDHLDAEQARYQAIQSGTLNLQNAIQNELDRARERTQRLRTLQARITLVLVLLALGALAAVARVWWNLHVLAGEAQHRRTDAVRARREIDALMGATGDGVVGMDLEGRCTSVNRAGCELLGYVESALKGRDVHDVLHHTTSEGGKRGRQESPLLTAVMHGTHARSTDVDVLWRRDGTPLPVQWSVRPLVDGTELKGAVLTFTDMTEIQEKEEELRRAVRTREEVVSIVSHDLRNPLGVVAAAADLLLDLPLDKAERNKQAGIIKRSAERMSRLIAQLLDVSRIEARALVMRPAHEDVADVLEEARAIFAAQAEDRGIDLEVRVEEGLPKVMLDRDRILQALSNLLDNALKMTRVGGHVTLDARAAGKAGVTISVADTGPGVPEEAMGHLFDRFWQASRQDRTGTGLGLAIVRGIVEAHGGTVSVESPPGQGAVFHIHLDVDADPASGTENGGAEA